MHPKDLDINEFQYLLPDECIAKYPLQKRDASRLLVYRNGVMTDALFSQLANLVPPGAMFVFNQTKVLPARLLFTKATGGTIELFCLAPDTTYADMSMALASHEKVVWKCLIGGAAKWKQGYVPELRTTQFTLTAHIVARGQGLFLVEFRWDNAAITFAEILELAGTVPLPPYLGRKANEDDKSRYQALFAKHPGSVAAPTASLHFTDAVMESLHQKGCSSTYVTLHVGAGTFKPVKSATMAGHEMHEEWIEVNLNALRSLVEAVQKPLIATGTTALRTLESLYHIGSKLHNNPDWEPTGIAVSQWEAYDTPGDISFADSLRAIIAYLERNKLQRLVTRTQILIAPGYQFRTASGLITNFHQPASTLLLLVSAFTGGDWRKIYHHAMEKQYRFLSYGDASLLWRE